MNETEDRTVICDDGYVASVVRPWAIEDKHPRLRNYIGASSSARKKFGAGCAYIDPFCGPGRVCIAGQREFSHGSPMVALEESTKRSAFTTFAIGDADQSFVDACRARLSAAGAERVMAEVGPATETTLKLVSNLDRSGLHFAFLDPFNIAHLPFSVIKALGDNLKRVDLLIHFSAMDLQRNVPNFLDGSNLSLDHFAPDWRSAVKGHETGPQNIIRERVIEHWCELIRKIGFKIYKEGFELVSGERNQPLYWLVLASRHDVAHKLWGKIRNVSKQSRLFG